tara:strand:+ start:1550 stop:1762 length:213 start_codon:yes stop_codon:yes gene_type:complete
MNYLQELPFDLQELIGQKLHALYMNSLKEEIYEECLEYEWRRDNNLGDDFDEDWEVESSQSDESYSCESE